MATLTGQTIATSYEQLLSLPDGGGNSTTLVALTDGDAGTTFSLQLSTQDAKISTAGSASGLLIDNTASDGDAILGFQLSGVSKFTMGVDDGDSDAFKIGTTAVGTNTRLLIDSNGSVGVGVTSPNCQSLFEVRGGLTTTGAVMTLATNEPSVVANDVLGRINFNAPLDTGADSDLVAASIVATANSTFSDTVNATSLYFQTGASETATTKMAITSTGKIGMGDTSPDAWLTINQAADDDNILSFKSSDVTHGFTDIAETDTYALFDKNDSSGGGLKIKALRDSAGSDSHVLVLQAYGQNAASTTKSTSGRNLAEIYTSLHDGSNAYADITADGNIFGVRCRRGGADVTVAIIDEDGEIHSDGGAQSAYDSYDDAHLVRSFDLSHGNNVINSKFDKFINYNHEKLAELKLVGRDEDGTPNHFINVTGMQRLHNGAIWQQYEEHQKLLNAFVKLAEKTVGLEEAKALIEDNEIKKLGDA